MARWVTLACALLACGRIGGGSKYVGSGDVECGGGFASACTGGGCD